MTPFNFLRKYCIPIDVPSLSKRVFLLLNPILHSEISTEYETMNEHVHDHDRGDHPRSIVTVALDATSKFGLHRCW